MSQFDPTFDLKRNVGHCDLYFMVQWFCLISWRLFDIWTPYFGIMSQYDPMFDPKNNCRSLWPIFHGPVILPYIFKIIWYMNTILLFYESVWLDIWPKINVGHCDLYFMVQWICLISWKLFSSWTIYFGNMSQYDPNVWPQNIYRSLWPIFHDPVILPYILKTVWCLNIILCDNESV